MTNVAQPNGASEKSEAETLGMTAVHTAPAKYLQVLLEKWEENKVTTSTNKMPCGHILYIQIAMPGAKQSSLREKPPPVTLSSCIDFYAQIMTYMRMIKCWS